MCADGAEIVRPDAGDMNENLDPSLCISSNLRRMAAGVMVALAVSLMLSVLFSGTRDGGWCC